MNNDDFVFLWVLWYMKAFLPLGLQAVFKKCIVSQMTDLHSA